MKLYLSDYFSGVNQGKVYMQTQHCIWNCFGRGEEEPDSSPPTSTLLISSSTRFSSPQVFDMLAAKFILDDAEVVVGDEKNQNPWDNGVTEWLLACRPVD
jgi:hypothetical protein